MIPGVGGREEKGGGKRGLGRVEKKWKFNLCFEIQKKRKLGLQSSIKNDGQSKNRKFMFNDRNNRCLVDAMQFCLHPHAPIPDSKYFVLNYVYIEIESNGNESLRN